MVKNLLANAGDLRETIRSLGWEDPLEKGMATHSSILAWRIPWTEEPGGSSPKGHKESDTTKVTYHECMQPKCPTFLEIKHNVVMLECIMLKTP